MKRLFSVIIALIVLCCSVTTVFAADGKVTYDGNSQKFIFEPGSEHSPTDLFPNFKDVMPGDTLTQKITVKNASSHNVKVKIYMRSLGAYKDSSDFLSQLGLKVQKSEDNEMAYMFDASANETAQLNDWMCLGTLYSGGEINLDISLTIPVELDNSYSNNKGYLDWEFKVEELPIEESDPKPPQTGDAFNLGWWIFLAVGSLITMLILILCRKKEKKQKA